MISQFFVIFCLLSAIKCDIKEDVRAKVKQLRERSLRLYGDAKPRTIKQWELDVEDTLSYPNGDKQKLAEIAQRWSDYYHCTSRMVDALTSSNHLPHVNVAVYQGAVARLPCGLCVAPGENGYVSWFYAQSRHNITFTRLDTKATIVRNINLTIYKAEEQDAGIYRCQIGSSVSGFVVLEVLDDDDYNVVSATEPYSLKPPSPLRTSQNVVVFTSWSPWSECSRCNHVGFRRRHGMCYVRLDTNKHTTETANLSRVTHKLLKDFPAGISCQSELLPQTFLSTINTSKNTIMTEPCKVPCMEIFEIWSKSGELIERANNTAGVYSLNQELPLPPALSRDVVFVESGEKLTLKCPGTTLRDVPITWRVGTKRINADTFTKGRIHLSPRDFIVFSSVEYGDTNVYSCWQSLNLAGVVKLEVWTDARLANGRPIAIVSLIIVALTLRFTVRLLRSKLNPPL